MPEGIPPSLRSNKRWFTWKYVPDPKKPEKPKKIPFCTQRSPDGRVPPARSNDPATWSSFDDAVKAWQRHRHSGIGYVLGPGEVGIDFDGCRDVETGAIADWAQAWIDRLASYSEVSPSGAGVKVIVWATIAAAMKCALGEHIGVEIYDSARGRYFAMTGQRLDGTPAEICSAQDAIDALIAHYRPVPTPTPEPPAAPPAPAPTPPVAGEGWRRDRAAAVDAEWRQWVQRKRTTAESTLKTAPAGSLHHTRVRMAKLLGGVIAAAPAYLDATTATDILFSAKLPETHGATERRAIIDGLGYGQALELKGDDLPTFPTDEDLIADAQGRACCPRCGARVARSRYDYAEGQPPGLYCPQCSYPQVWPCSAWDGAAVVVPGAPKATLPPPIDAPILGAAHLTDLGNAECLAELYGGVMRYNHTRKAWLIWDGSIWRMDEDGAAQRAMAAVARSRLRASADCDDLERRKKLAAWALSSENTDKVEKALKSGRSLLEFATRMPQYDRDPLLIGAPGVTIDLRTGEARPPQREDYITMQIGTAYNPQARCPRWLQFLSEVFDEDGDLIGFIQKAVGYCLSGDTSEQKLFLCHGGGANGKGVFLETVAALLGDYATATPFDTFDATSRNEQTNNLARLHGMRMVSASEAEEGRRLAEARVKSITGQDPITARFLFQEFFTFRPQFKLWLAMNHLPIIRGTDRGIWRRILIVPFLVSFEGREDKRLKAELRDELPGILNWALAGWHRYVEEGLAPPEAVVVETRNYQAESDQVGRWVEDRTIAGEGCRAVASRAYADYMKWVEEQGEKPFSQKFWGHRLSERGHERFRTAGAWHWRGLGLVDTDRRDPHEGERS
jgi:putative DNA primase/helicase